MIRFLLLSLIAWGALAFGIYSMATGKSFAYWHWYDFLFLGGITLVQTCLAIVVTLCFIYEAFGFKKVALEKEMEEADLRYEKWLAEFNAVMNGLGIMGDPFDHVMKLTRDGKLKWRLSEPDGSCGIQFEADFKDGIKVLARGSNMVIFHPKPESRIIHHFISFEDSKERFDSMVNSCNYFEHPDSEKKTLGSETRPKELIDILTRKFGVAIAPQ